MKVISEVHDKLALTKRLKNNLTQLLLKITKPTVQSDKKGGKITTFILPPMSSMTAALSQ